MARAQAPHPINRGTIRESVKMNFVLFAELLIESRFLKIQSPGSRSPFCALNSSNFDGPSEWLNFQFPSSNVQ